MKPFPSTIVIYQNQSIADQKINEICHELNNDISPNNPDIFIINDSTGWTIELTRSLKKFLSQKPFNHQNKICLIYQAHNLNSESQNALLKTLEDPGENNYLVLTTSKPSSLLPTIISRCHLIRLNDDTKNSPKSKIIQITGNFTKDSVALESLYKNKDQILPYLQDQLQIYQQILIETPNQSTNQIVKNIIKAINMIDANVDPRSALDFVFLI
jgi:DNA polymerase III gamma/tau subunit